MKRVLLSTFLLLGLNSLAGIITCSNNPNSPGQYTSLQDAIDNANAYDTILIAGSPTHYGSVIINSKALTLIGAGVNNPNGSNTEINYIDLERISSGLSASGTKLIGIRFLNTVRIDAYYDQPTGLNQTISDITIERCYGGNYYFYGGAACTFENFMIKNNVVGVINLPSANLISNFKIINNFITSGSVRQNGQSDNSDVLVSNNVFMWNDQFAFNTSSAPTTNPGMIVNNNIFYYASPNTSCYNCSFSNNITYLNNDDNLIGSGNPGSTGGANIIGQNPNFVNYPIAGAAFDFSYDYHLQSGSPGISAGTDGTDIGVYGGVSPFTDAADVGANPAIPQMQEITTPLGSTVSKGTNLNVNFKSYKQD